MLKIWVLLFGIFFTTQSFAIGSLIVAAAYGLSAGATLTFTQAAIAMAINFAVSYVVSRAFTPKINDVVGAGGTKDNGVRQQIPPSTTNGLPIVYGDAYLGGVFVDAVLTIDQKAMYYVMAISSISPNGQFSYDTSKFYYADRLMEISGSSVTSLTDGAGNIDTKINGNLSIYLYTSNASGVITPVNTILMPDEVMGGSDINVDQQWSPTDRQMYGTAFAIIKLNYNRDAGTTQLQAVTFHCSQYLNSQGVAKPGDVWQDYLSNNQYGGAVQSTYINSASATALNTYSDEYITYTDSDGNPSSQPRYRINGVLDCGVPVLENVDKILTACDSWMAYNAASGSWSIIVNKPQTVAMAFDDSNLIGDIRVSAIDINQSINQIEAKFPSKLNRDQSDYVNLKTPTYLLFPNEPVNKYSITYDMVNDSVQAQYLANRTLEQAREDLIVAIQTTYNGIQIDAGDIVSITNVPYGWTNKLFRVTKVNEASLPDGNLGASLELNEYNAQVYDDKDITEYQPTPNSNLASPSYFSIIYGPTISNVDTVATIPNFTVNCGLPSVGRVDSVTLFYTTSSSPTPADWVVWGTQTSTESTPFTPSTNIQFRDVNLPTATYYFAFKLSNFDSQSILSPLSSPFSWNPNPTTSAVAGTFIANWTPPVEQVPRTGGITPVFTGIVPQLYGTAAGGAINFVDAQDDSDLTFTDNTWRIGGSSTTGYGDIVKSGITIGDPTDGGNYAQFPQPSAMSTSPASLNVPVRYKDSLGNVVQSAASIINFLFLDPGATGADGLPGNQAASVNLYQWNTTTPTAPSGTSSFNWSTGVNSSYSGGGGWDTVVPTNPGIALIQLWVATKQITAVATATLTSVDWTTGVTTAIYTENGANGLQSASPTVYQWAVTIPSSPTGTSTYTWATNTISGAPSGWSLNPGTSPSAGYTLWGASVNLVANASDTTSTISWTSSSITARGYSGTNGSTGTTGASARICYTKTTLSSLASTPTTITTTGSSSFPPNDSWGTGTIWQATAPAIIAGESVYQSDGIYSPSTGNTVWNVPYISALKVGSLSAISANTGTLTVTGTMSSANGNFAVDSLGAVTIRSATTGGRMEINNETIAVYDDLNTLRVLIGKLD